MQPRESQASNRRRGKFMQSIEPHRSINGGLALCEPPALHDNEWLRIERFVPMAFRRPASLTTESESPTRDAHRVEAARPSRRAAHSDTPDSAFSTGPSLEVESML